jgi:Zn-finger nucleic acid-binding protein
MTKTKCPDCGLLLEVQAENGNTEVQYDRAQWERECRRVWLDGPLWCLLDREGTKPTNH